MNPYDEIPAKGFWRQAVADLSPFNVKELWDPKFHMRWNDPVATFGSCFAQHIGRALRDNKYNWLITEKPPYGMSPENVRKFNYNIFSARTANIYTTTLLKQWTSWALNHSVPPDEIWIDKGSYFDPFRPRIEPEGFATAEELFRLRHSTIRFFKQCIVQSKYFVFTLGLTESWVNSRRGYEYPMCPGTAAGTFDPTIHEFINLGFDEVRTSLLEAIEMMRVVNPDLKFLLTVSPVPLTATNSGKHVLVATMQSKSILRAVAGTLSDQYPYIDYFPSYEIINSPVFRGMFFEPNQRNVAAEGVNFVMSQFFESLHGKFGKPQNAGPAGSIQARKEDEICEEELLSAFGGAR